MRKKRLLLVATTSVHSSGRAIHFARRQRRLNADRDRTVELRDGRVVREVKAPGDPEARVVPLRP